MLHPLSIDAFMGDARPDRRRARSAGAALGLLVLLLGGPAAPAVAVDQDLPGSLRQAQRLGLNPTEPAWLSGIRQAGVGRLELAPPSVPPDPAIDIDLARARRIAEARAHWEWGENARVASILPVLGVDGRVTAYDADVTLDGSRFESYNAVVSDWQSFLRARETDPTPPESVAVHYATVVVSATYDRPPILTTRLGPSSFFASGWLAAGIAARLLGTPAPTLQGLVFLCADYRIYQFTDGSRTVFVQGELPWAWGEAESCLPMWRAALEKSLRDGRGRIAARGGRVEALVDSVRSHYRSCADRWVDGGYPARSEVWIMGYSTCFIEQQPAVDIAEACLSMRMNYYDERLYYGKLTGQYMSYYNAFWEQSFCHTPDLDRAWEGHIDGSDHPEMFYQAMVDVSVEKGYWFRDGIDGLGDILDWRVDDGMAEIDSSHPFVWSFNSVLIYFPYTVVGYDTAPEPDEWLAHSPVWRWTLWHGLQRMAVSGWYNEWVYYSGPHPYEGDYGNISLSAPDGNPNWDACEPGSAVPAGDYYTIRWDQWGSPGAYVDIDYSPDGGWQWIELAYHHPDTGWFSWWPTCDFTDEGRIRVKQYSPAGELISADGSYGNFSVIDPPLPAPQLLSPVNYATCVSPLSVLVTWSSISHATAYNVRLGNSCGGGDIHQVTSNSYEYTSLLPETYYYWQVQAVNRCGHEMPWSSCFYFTTGPTTLPPPSLVSPADGATCQGTSGTLQWSPVSDATGYTVLLYYSCDSGTGMHDVTGTSYDYQDLVPGTTYYWKVRTKDACGNPGTWSACRHFTVAPEPLVAPTLLSPPNGSTTAHTSGTLDWTDVSGAAGYRVRIGTSCGMGDVYTIDGPTSQYAYSGLANHTTYYWQVATKSPCGQYGTYSDCFHFTTRDPATFVVQPDGGGTYPTIQAAINASVNGDIIELTDGTFTGAGNRDLTYGGRAITIRSQSGNPQTCVINCMGAPGDMHRGFAFSNGETALAILDGVRITNGYAPNGGALYFTGTTRATIINCYIDVNYATTGGGAVYCVSGAMPVFDACEFYGNVSNGDGGAFYCAGASPTLAGCRVWINHATYNGGGLFATSGTPPLSHTIFQGNSAGTSGGALWLQTNSSPSPAYCQFVLNTAEVSGGAVYCYNAANPYFTRCTFSENGAPTGGGLVVAVNANVSLDHSIISFARQGGSVYCDGTGDATLSCCDVYGNTGGDWIGCIAGQNGSNHNFSADPLYCNPALANWALHLDSPCAAANNVDCGQVGARDIGCGPSQPAQVTVNADGSGAYPTIQAALSDIPSGSTILLTDGTYRGDGNRDLRWNGKSITLRSQSDNPSACVIDCQGSDADPHRAFQLDFGEGVGCRIEGLTVRDGYRTDNGGGLLTQNTSPVLRNCIFENCYAGAYGGAVYGFYHSDAIFEDCVFRNNASGSYGGAVDFWNECEPEFAGCVFEGNSSATGGAADIYNLSLPTFSGCTFVENGATLGGAVYCDTGCQPYFAGCTFYGNEAPRRTPPPLAPAGVTHAGRRTPGGRNGTGGTIFSTWSSVVQLRNSIIAFGTAGEAVACASGASVTVTCSDIFGNAGGDWVDCIASQAGQNGNLCLDPQFCDAAEGHLTLRADSPCAEGNQPTCGAIGAQPVACGYHHVVEADGSGAFPTIQAAVDAVPEDDVVDLADGVYTGTGNRDVDFRGKRITVRSESGDPAGVTIDCQGSPSERHRGFFFHTAEPAGTVLEGVTVMNGDHEYGAGVDIRAAGTAPTIRNCRFHSGTATYGGGICISEGGSATLEDCSVYDNAATYVGGILLLDADATIARCTIADNQAASLAPGIFRGNNADLTLSASIVAINQGGPGVVCNGSGSITVTCTDVWGNSGGDWVGCIESQAGQNGNLCLDPIFCDAAGHDFTLSSDSPCADGYNPSCGRLGGEPVTCVPSDVDGGMTLPTRLSLGPSLPNPFGCGTVIEYGLPPGVGQAAVRLAIYNVSGRQVRTLVEDNQAPGIYRVAWDGTDDQQRRLGSGVYFARLQAGPQVKRYALVLTR